MVAQMHQAQVQKCQPPGCKSQGVTKGRRLQTPPVSTLSVYKWGN